MYEIYKIEESDTLPIIANKTNTTVEELKKINDLNDNYQVIPNNLIIVPKVKNNNYNYYTVKKGDSIYKIASDNNIDYDLLLKINGLDKDDYIYPNQTILIPNKDINLYLTKEGDTLKKILDNMNNDFDNLLRNNSVYIEPEQIIIFKEK